MKTKFILIAVSLMLFSCSSYNLVNEKEYQAKGLKLKGDKRVSYFIYDAQSKRTYTLSEPPPDAILEKATKLANDVNIKNKTTDTDVSTAQKVELANKVVQLGERTVAVNILRDALFRLSEMNINNRNEELKKDYKELFDSILSVAKEIALSDKAKSEAVKTQAEASKIEANTELMKTIDLNGLENQGLEFILNDDLTNAKLSFEKLQELSPRFHSASEISGLLSKYDAKSIKKEDLEAIKKEIINKYSWKMNEDIKAKFNSFK